MAKFWYILKIHSIVIVNVLNVEHEKTQGSKHIHWLRWETL